MKIWYNLNMNNKVKTIKKGVEVFCNEVKKEVNGRYKSWEHCYQLFYDAIKNNKKEDVDNLALNLAFYLASWGMYRGSTFLLQKDYKIHSPAVDIILKSKYKELLDIKCKDLINKIELLFELVKELDNYYDEIRTQVAINRKKEESKASLSRTLLTKVLMGTLGCVPTYDRYLLVGLKTTGIASQTFNENSIKKICKFYVDNETDLENIRKNLKVGNIKYPQMKLIDMGLWYSAIFFVYTK